MCVVISSLQLLMKRSMETSRLCVVRSSPHTLMKRWIETPLLCVAISFLHTLMKRWIETTVVCIYTLPPASDEEVNGDSTVVCIVIPPLHNLMKGWMDPCFFCFIIGGNVSRVNEWLVLLWLIKFPQLCYVTMALINHQKMITNDYWYFQNKKTKWYCPLCARMRRESEGFWESW